jgi:NADPH:quinone reductase-like Zn-dependent oxidoreductase
MTADIGQARMRAITYRKYGPPEVLQISSVPRPNPGANEILIAVRAAEVTKSDCELRSFRFPVKWFWLPLRLAFGVFRPRRRILGGYFSGVVEALGRNVAGYKVGDEVFGCAALRLGAYAQYVSLPARYTVTARPGNMSFEEAAAVPLGGLNALHFMKRAGIRTGEQVLVNGAGGSIGSHAVQIAKSMGAEVTAVDSALKESTLRRLGADHFIDYRKEDFTACGRRFDIILDMVAGSSYSGCIGALNPKGRYLKANPRLMDMIRSVLTTRLTDKKSIFAFAGESRAELRELRRMIESGSIRPVVDRVFSMTEVAAAHTLVESEQRCGAVVLRIS